jgi:hypothetical protein
MSFQFPKRQAVLLGEAGLDFLFTLLDPHFMPTTLYVICPKAQINQALFFQTAIDQIGISSEIWAIDEDKAQSIEQISKQLIEKLNIALKQKTPIVLNASSGSRLLSFIAPKVFEQLSCPVFYCYRGILSRLGQNPQHLKINAKFSVHQIFKFFGIQIHSALKREEVNLELVYIYRTLFENVDVLSQSLSVLMKWANEAKQNQMYSKPLSGGDVSLDYVNDLIKYLEDSGLIELNKGKVFFFSEDVRQFCAGGWVGFLLFDTLTNLGVLHKINDLRFNLYFSIEIQPKTIQPAQPIIALEAMPPSQLEKRLKNQIEPSENSNDEDDFLPADQSNEMDLIKLDQSKMDELKIDELKIDEPKMEMAFELESQNFESLITDLKSIDITQEPNIDLPVFKIEFACIFDQQPYFFLSPQINELDEYIEMIKSFRQRFSANLIFISHMTYPLQILQRCHDLKIPVINGQEILSLQDHLQDLFQSH